MGMEEITFEGYALELENEIGKWYWDFKANAFQPDYHFNQYCIGAKWEAINKNKEIPDGKVRQVSCKIVFN